LGEQKNGHLGVTSCAHKKDQRTKPRNVQLKETRKDRKGLEKKENHQLTREKKKDQNAKAGPPQQQIPGRKIKRSAEP